MNPSVQFPEDQVEETRMNLPGMMFADGEEPVGVRVLTYQSSRAINSILSALDEEEIQFIRQSSFGKLMLRKKTVTDKDIRIKLACLAIVSSVLLSTNLKMKMLKEHAELLEDIDEFFSFPWGRLAFDMLMTSIKKKDEISLSQNSVALKGFAFALQLVIVEAVPSLTEVVQESCSSSESDSDEDDVDRSTRKTKKKTLSPAHAREVDKKEEVMVRSIIPQDPARPVDESVLVWSDEVDDAKVSFMLCCINDNHIFTKDMFRGGVTKADVERMREKAKTAGKKKGIPRKDKAPPVCLEGDIRITSIVNAILRPEVNRIDGNIADVVSSVKEVSAQSVGCENKVIAIVEGMLQSFKTEMMKFMPTLHTQSAFAHPNSTAAGEEPGVEGVPSKTTPIPLDDNDEIIENVMENISHYSTPPAAENECPVHVQPESIHKHLSNMHSNGKGGKSVEDQSSRSGHSQTEQQVDPIVPSFSLGLTQELREHPHEDDDEMGENEDQGGGKGNGEVVVDGGEALLCRKSKRIRTVPPQLLTDYQCGTALLNRAREGQIFGNGAYDVGVIHEKYSRLKILLKNHCVINVAGLSVTGKDITDIGERNRFLPGRVMDILLRVVSASVNNKICGTSHSSPVFLDSGLQVLLARNFQKFRRAKSGTPYIFTKALVDMVVKSLNSNTAASRFYMPLSLSRKHWVGISVDFNAGKIYVLDCNPEVTNANVLTKEVAPLCEMFPCLLKHCGCLPDYLETALAVETVKGMVHNTNPAEAALTACLLMCTHALYGPESCSTITPSIIPDESQRVAVLIYEFHKKL
ncbi:hypothetical protein HID58_040100 [Brassica napus]|uniref:Ubiquitin-like protease family profile domain-containing protein n=1 Tax=Brassica napus TaxID=3708 RepID=A0ABQ8B725_BRANA|nr:hypothetical protein HID58_040100 [Brassica napus]